MYGKAERLGYFCISTNTKDFEKKKTIIFLTLQLEGNDKTFAIRTKIITRAH